MKHNDPRATFTLDDEPTGRRDQDAPQRYELGQEIARGGMGSIHTARDAELDRPVAIKRILDPRPSLMARFDREARITARLQHPGIIPIYERGRLPDGTPYYAMKLVSGRSLEEILGDLHGLEARLALLPEVLAVAEAIAYAHQHDVVHRDIKPANILLGALGETLVIDWGIAKELHIDEEPADELAPTAAGRTAAGIILGTPTHMAPEQARGTPADRRSDVYSLGVVLYELLSGRLPYQADSSEALIDELLQAPPPELDASLPADLRAIVARAMARDPAERYPSAEELAADLRRFQTGKLVETYRYKPRELLLRWLRANRAPITVACAALVVLVALSTWGVLRLVEARDLAEARRVEAEQRRVAAEKLVTFIAYDLREQLEAAGRLDMLQRTAQEIRIYYDSVPEQEGPNRAAALEILGDSLRAAGDLEGARAAHEEALAIREQLASADPGATVSLATSHRKLAEVLVDMGKLDPAIGLLERGDQLLAGQQESPARRELTRVGTALGDVLASRGTLDEARSVLAQASALAQELVSEVGDLASHADLAEAELAAGRATWKAGDHLAALASHERAVALAEQLRAGDPVSSRWLHLEARAHIAAGHVLADLGRLQEALAAFRAAVRTCGPLVERDPSNTDWLELLAYARSMEAYALSRLGRTQESLQAQLATMALLERLTEHDAGNPLWANRLVLAQLNLAPLLMQLGRTDEALQALQGCLAKLDAQQVDPSNWALRLSNGEARAEAGGQLVRLGATEQGLQALAAGVGELEAAAAQDPSATHPQLHLAIARSELGRALLEQDQRDQARRLFLLARDALTELEAGGGLRAGDDELLAGLERWIADLGGG